MGVSVGALRELNIDAGEPSLLLPIPSLGRWTWVIYRKVVEQAR